MNVQVSLHKTIVFSFICLFFTFVAWHWELINRYRFKKTLRYKSFDTQELINTISDYEKFASCEDPIIEHFLEKHPQFFWVSSLWIVNTKYWQRLHRKELKRRGIDYASFN